MTDTRTTTRPLNVTQACRLADIIRAAQTNARVARALLPGDRILVGTARHLVKSPDSVGFLGVDDDVRDAYLRITTVEGFEVFIEVSTLISELADGHFVIGYES